MTTLYDVLGALPGDNSDELRAAFRRAVKSAHPDLRPGDPNAARRFRQILRANDILVDTEQRAAYDHLLVLAEQEKELEQKQNAKRAVAAKLHRLASAVMIGAGVSAAIVGGCLLLMQMPADAVARAISMAQSLSRAPNDWSAASTVSVPPVTIAPLPPLSMKAAAIKTDAKPVKRSEIASAAPTAPGQAEMALILAPTGTPVPFIDQQTLPLGKAEDRPSDTARAPCLLADGDDDCSLEVASVAPSPAPAATKLKTRPLDKTRAATDALGRKPQLRPLRADELRLTRMSQRQSVSD